MVTVELAMGTVTATVLAAFLVTLTMLGVTQAAAAESSAQIARQMARGDEQAELDARRRAPGEVRVAERDGGVEVTVRATSFVFALGHVPVEGTTWVAYEPGERA